MYNFSCTCEACTNNYPLAKDLPKSYVETLTQCPSKSIDDLKELDSKNLKLGEKILDALEDNDLCQIEQLYCQRLQMACQHLSNPHMIILSNRLKQGYFHNLHWRQFGNFMQSHIIKSLNYDNKPEYKTSGLDLWTHFGWDMEIGTTQPKERTSKESICRTKESICRRCSTIRRRRKFLMVSYKVIVDLEKWKLKIFRICEFVSNSARKTMKTKNQFLFWKILVMIPWFLWTIKISIKHSHLL